MRNTFRILFYVNKQRVIEGRVPIYVRLSINGKSTFVSSRQRIPLSLWDSAANKAAGKSIEAKVLFEIAVELVKGLQQRFVLLAHTEIGRLHTFSRHISILVRNPLVVVE